MIRVRIIPVVLLQKGGLYKTVQFRNPVYVGDPINTVKIFNEKEVDELMIRDFSASVDQTEIDIPKLPEIAGEAFMPMSYGGAIRTFADAKKVLDAGYEKVVLNSVLFDRPGIIGEIAAVYGAQAVVAAIDVKKNLFGKYKCYSFSGKKNTGWDPVDWALELEKYGVGEILVNSIASDGCWSGYDLNIISKIAAAVGIPVIACGGASATEDFKLAVEAGASAVAAGSLFVFQKKRMGVLINFPSGFKLLK